MSAHEFVTLLALVVVLGYALWFILTAMFPVADLVADAWDCLVDWYDENIRYR